MPVIVIVVHIGCAVNLLVCGIVGFTDTLVIATGSRVPFPGKDDEVTASACLLRYKAGLAATAASHRIAIVGGGPVGVELAG